MREIQTDTSTRIEKVSVIHSEEWIVELVMRKAFLEITEAALSKTDSAISIDTTTDPFTDDTPKLNEKIVPKCNFKILDLELVRQYLLEFGVDLSQTNTNTKPP